MTINVKNLCYNSDLFSKFHALAAAEDLFSNHMSFDKPNYIPVPDNGECEVKLYSSVPTVFVSVKSLTPAMLRVFQNCEEMDEKSVISQLNGTVYDYAVNVVKELLADDNANVVGYAIKIARKYRLYSMSLLPCGYHYQFRKLDEDCYETTDITECGKMLHNAIR